MLQHGTNHPAQEEPLTLSVHTLPDVVNPNFMDAAPAGRGKLLALLFAILLPLLVLYLIFFVIKPADQSGFGVAIAPAHALPDVTLRDLAGQPIALPVASGQWRLIGVGPGRCEDRCVKHIFIQRQLREMLLKKGVQIERLWLLLDDDALPEPPARLLQSAQVLRATPEQAAQVVGMPSADARSQLFVANPQGQLVMRMPADQDSAQVRAAMWTLQQQIAAQGAATAQENRN